MKREAVRRWLDRFEATAQRERQALLAEGAQAPTQSIQNAMSLIRFSQEMASQAAVLDRARWAEDQGVQETWHTLRTRLRR